MKNALLIALVLMATTASAQHPENNPKDLWTSSVDVTLGDNWREKSIVVPGNAPNVVDFYRAFAKAYPCEYHDLLTQALDGDREVLFCHVRPRISINRDSCFIENESFSMRVFHEDDKPVALGVCCHKAITTELQDAYYFRYDNASRKLIPLAQGSDFTGGILKRTTKFSPYNKNYEDVTMVHGAGRCAITSQLKWQNGNFVFIDKAKYNFILNHPENVTMAVLEEFLLLHDMELREPEPEVDPLIEGGRYSTLPICVAVQDERSGGNFAAASAMEGFFYFYARGWQKTDGRTLVAIYTRCAPEFDHYKQKNEVGEYVTIPHKLEPGDEVSLHFYLCNKKGDVFYMDSSEPEFSQRVIKGMPNLDHNEWSCEISPDNEDLVFVNEANGKRKVFKWDGKLLKTK